MDYPKTYQQMRSMIFCAVQCFCHIIVEPPALDFISLEIPSFNATTFDYNFLKELHNCYGQFLAYRNETETIRYIAVIDYSAAILPLSQLASESKKADLCSEANECCYYWKI
jgi:hypothetical protein